MLYVEVSFQAYKSNLDTMPYILVRSAVLSSGGTTIKGNISQNARWQLQMQGSRGNETSLSSCDVLNILETEGYKVVGTNTVT